MPTERVSVQRVNGVGIEWILLKGKKLKNTERYFDRIICDRIIF